MALQPDGLAVVHARRYCDIKGFAAGQTDAPLGAVDGLEEGYVQPKAFVFALVVEPSATEGPASLASFAGAAPPTTEHGVENVA